MILLSSKRSSVSIAVIILAVSFLASAPRVTRPHVDAARVCCAEAGLTGAHRFTVNSSIERASEIDHEAHRGLRFATLAVIQTPPNIRETELTRLAPWPSARPLRRFKIFVSRADGDDPLA